MAKAKVKKQSTFIDMTAMSDVTVLLLTFFMLTSTFVQDEPVKVQTPASVSEIKIPESNLMTILVDSKGKIFMSFTNDKDKIETLNTVGEDYGITFTPKQQAAFKKLDSFGIPIRSMASFLDLPADQQAKTLKPAEGQTDIENPRIGIPTDTLVVQDARGLISQDNEFKRWVTYATTNNPDLLIAIKADKSTNYPVVKKVIDDLSSMRKYRYLLITSLKTASNI
ncbi:MAG: biopolymer transporter ExbD [Candidatus Azobacteroides sp.]|nr:biopolymer transporter ExbD [Candidatus Azobacteroides sp.]